MTVTGSFEIRRATPPDAGLLATVHRRTVLHAYAGIFPAGTPAPTLDDLTRQWRRDLADPATRALVAEDGGRPVGSVATGPDPEGTPEGELRRLHVLPERWGRGLGTALHDAALAALGERFAVARLWVLEGNQRARRFYERRGWVPVDGARWVAAGVGEVRYRRLVASAPLRSDPRRPWP